MKAQDVIAALLTRLPQETDRFTDTLALASASFASPTLTLETTTDHGLAVGNRFHLVGVRTPIALASFTRSGAVGTLVFSSPHDRVMEPFAPTLVVSGAVEAEFNGTFSIIDVPDRDTITVSMANSGPTAATGSPVAEDCDSVFRSFNRLLTVASVPTSTTLTTTVSGAAGAAQPDVSAAELRARPRVSGAVSFERALDTYTRQQSGKLWAYVVLDDVRASRGLEHKGDAADRQILDVAWRQQVISPFTVVVFVPAADDVAARRARDLMDEVWGPLCRSVLGDRLPSSLASALCSPVNFVGHAGLEYNRASYVHGFAFEAVEELVFEDTVGYNDSVAFRDVDYTITPDLDAAQGDGEMTGAIDLDEGA